MVENVSYAEFVNTLKAPPIRTEAGDDPSFFDVSHAIVGLATEGCEALDAWKAHMFYGKELDYTNLDEEMGDALFFIQLYANARGTTITQFQQLNEHKLAERYKNKKFTQEEALNRDLNAEREVLERHSESYVTGSPQDPNSFGAR